MSEVILAVLQKRETALALLRAAERLAVLANGGRLNVLAASPAAGHELRAAFDEWAAWPRTTPVNVSWHEVRADPVAEIEQRGSRADLIVIARPVEGDERARRHAFRAALLKSGRPVLVVPPQGASPDFGRRVAIAWRDDEHTAKAVLAALRYVAGAEQVFVLAGMREGRAVPSFRRC